MKKSDIILKILYLQQCKIREFVPTSENDRKMSEKYTGRQKIGINLPI